MGEVAILLPAAPLAATLFVEALAEHVMGEDFGLVALTLPANSLFSSHDLLLFRSKTLAELAFGHPTGFLRWGTSHTQTAL